MLKRVPAQMMFDDFNSVGRSRPRVMLSLAYAQVAAERVEEPEGRVGGVVEPFLFAVGKHVWDQAVADVMREGAQNVAGFQQCDRS